MALIAAALTAYERAGRQAAAAGRAVAASAWRRALRPRLGEPVKFEAEHGGRTVRVEVTGAGGPLHARHRGRRRVTVDARQTVEGIWSILVDGASYVADVTERDDRLRGRRRGRALHDPGRGGVALPHPHPRGATGAERGQVLKAPMPGKVTLVEVTVGQTVAPGDGLIVLEAMKMENEFKAAVAGTVKEIRVQAGQAVNPGDVLVVIE